MNSAILILGPGQFPDGSMLPGGDARIKAAYQKFTEMKKSSYVILSGGKKTCSTSEASTMRDFILHHYPSMALSLVLEELSTDTLQNVFFSKTRHIDPLEIKHLTVVTNAFHIPRTQQIFTYLFDATYQLEFVAAEDPEVDEPTKAKQKIIEDTAMKFNKNVLFSQDIRQNLKNLQALIFNQDSKYAIAYNQLIQQLTS